ncbi:hypothetical protein [Bacteroides pyogenes]|uniref:hypothetical protein n=1 Tax=Bacteroides pyogenes TaxID=310300 RepID=UPI001559F053|nr:hypothetical protein [Bacteroides pyogenes]
MEKRKIREMVRRSSGIRRGIRRIGRIERIGRIRQIGRIEQIEQIGPIERGK